MAHRGSRGIALHLHDQRHKKRVRGQRHATVVIYPRDRAGTHCTGGWVGPRASLDRCGKSRPTGIRSPYRPAHSQSLYRIGYSAHFKSGHNSKLYTTENVGITALRVRTNVGSSNMYLSSADLQLCTSVHSWKARPGLGKAWLLTVTSSHLRCNLRILTTYVLFLTESILVRLRSVWCRAKRARLQGFHRVRVGVTKRQNVVESIVKQSVFSGAIRRTTYTRVESFRIAGSVLNEIRSSDEAWFTVRENMKSSHDR
jgi:hypothetical protein